MTLNAELKRLIDESLDTSVKLYSEIKSTKNGLEKFVMQFGNVENPYDFMHGYFMGDLQGLAFGTIRVALGREMNEEEREDLAEIIKSKRIKIQNIVDRIKNIHIFDLNKCSSIN
ncbi:MAG: hypothetical protein COU45_06090 [Nitrosopumilus sp. CG10_big_fil_rev_8_21_14_0_10_33_7]|nr:MAG: hypothetical protein COU45_06090 [Nitrosopumilus sp. CG10_big_fil_rev_8_21_14_0_10_33_7]